MSLFALKSTQPPRQAMKLYFTRDRIASILRKLSIRVCSHRTIGIIAGTDFHPSDVLLSRSTPEDDDDCVHAEPWSDEEHRSFSKCDKCQTLEARTEYAFVAEESGSRDKYTLKLRLEICRDLGTLEHASNPGWRNHSCESRELYPSIGLWRMFRQDLDFMSTLWSVTPSLVDHSPSKREVRYNLEVEARRRKQSKAVRHEQKNLQKAPRRQRQTSFLHCFLH